MTTSVEATFSPSSLSSHRLDRGLSRLGLTPDQSGSCKLALLSLLFIVTGGIGLLVEQSFERLLSTIIGSNTSSGVVVLAVYFMGLALGGSCYGIWAHRIRRPLHAYGFLELGIGAWAMLIFGAFGPLQTLLSQLIGIAGEHPTILFTIRMTISMLWILPPAIAMGASFPAIVGSLRALGVARPRETMVLFYGLNLVGAIIATLIGPYWLFFRFGISGTLVICAIAELLVFIIAMVLSPPAETPSSSTEKKVFPKANRILLADVRFRWILLLAFFSGFIFFSFEALWIHLVGTVIGTSTFAFSTMLFCVLVGLFLGSVIINTLFRHHSTVPYWALAAIVALAAFFVGASQGAWDDVPALFGKWGAGLTTFREGVILRTVMCVGLIIPPATALGMIYPLIFRLADFPLDHRDSASGLIVAVNAVGSFIGAMVSGFFLLPTIGSEASYFSLTLVLGSLGLFLALREWYRVRRTVSSTGKRHFGIRSLLTALSCLAVMLWHSQAPRWDLKQLTSGFNVYFAPGFTTPESKLLFWHEDHLGGITTVIENRSATGTPYHVLLTNGKFQGNDAWEMDAQIGIALVPLLYTAKFDRAAVIGLGTGHSAHIIHAAGFKHVDLFENAPGILEAARSHFSHVNGNVLDQNNVRLVIDDGRNALLRAHAPYDVISLEISSIWFAGATNLYCKEFYQIAKRNLAQGGVLQQWIQFHHIDPYEIRVVIATLKEVFPHVAVWFVGNQGILIASTEPLELKRANIEWLKEHRRFQEVLGKQSRWQGAALDRFAINQLLSSDETERLYRYHMQIGGHINTDRNRYIEFATPRHNLMRNDAVPINLKALIEFVPEEKRVERLKIWGLVKSNSTLK